MQYKQAELEKKTMVELYQIAKDIGFTGYSKLRKATLVCEIARLSSIDEPGEETQIWAEGMLEIREDGVGFIRADGYLPSSRDVYVSQSQIHRFDLRVGDYVGGTCRKPRNGERYFGLLRVERVNGIDPEKLGKRLHFPGLTPIYPNEQLKLETGKNSYAMRMIDLIAPLGKGQRGLIVAPPKAGKTELIRQVANSIAENNPEVTVIILLIDERPEEVTEIERSVKAQVVSSTFDEVAESHVKLAEKVMIRAKRVVETGLDCVILLDSLTRLARAYNMVTPPSGRLLSGGVDPAALHKPKRFFGAARNVEDGGSLTILATALVDTGSRMDEVIFEEFKGTGNMELVLDRKLADRRIYPALDIKRSGTRKEEKLLSKEELSAVWKLRRKYSGMDVIDATENLLEEMKNSSNNAEMCQKLIKENRK